MAGAKATNLALIQKFLGAPVPPGFVITARATHLFFQETGLAGPVGERLARLSPEAPELLDEASRAIRDLVLEAEVPAALAAEILQAYQDLEAKTHPNVRLAMRSSAVGEDSEASFAGQYETVLNVTADNLLAAYKKVLASKYSPRAIAYRLRYGLEDWDTLMCVAGIMMVEARASGVLYTVDPARPDWDRPASARHDWRSGPPSARGRGGASSCRATVTSGCPSRWACSAMPCAASGGWAWSPRRAMPWPRASPPSLLAELGARAGDPATQGATFEAAVRYVQALAAERGLLLVLEDLHWADASSLTLAALLARSLASRSIAIVVSYRPDEDVGAAALEEFRRELRRIRVPELLLGPLAADEAVAMLEELLGRRPEPDVEAELIRLSGGNPFALEELAQAVVDSGWVDPETGRRQSEAAVDVPWTLADSIRARSSRLAGSERELLRWAAVIGEQFDIRLLAAAARSGQAGRPGWPPRLYRRAAADRGPLGPFGEPLRLSPRPHPRSPCPGGSGRRAQHAPRRRARGSRAA